MAWDAESIGLVILKVTFLYKSLPSIIFPIFCSAYQSLLPPVMPYAVAWPWRRCVWWNRACNAEGTAPRRWDSSLSAPLAPAVQLPHAGADNFISNSPRGHESPFSLLVGPQNKMSFVYSHKCSGLELNIQTAHTY